MGIETKDEIAYKIDKIHRYWQETGIDASNFAKDMNPDVTPLRLWFIARRNSLKIGSLPDDVIRIFSEYHMDFGIDLLLWHDWAELAEKYLRETGKDYIPETLIVKGDLKLGKWAKRQTHSVSKLTEEQEYRLMEIGLLTGVSGSTRVKDDSLIIYKGKTFTSISELAKRLGISWQKAYSLLEVKNERLNAQRSEINYGENAMDRNFNKCRFKLTLPTVFLKDGNFSIVFNVQPMHGVDGLLVLQECKIVDSAGEIIGQNTIIFEPSIMELSKGPQRITVSLSEKVYRKRNVGLNIEYTLLDIKAKKKVKVYYEIVSDIQKNLMGVEVEEYDMGIEIPITNETIQIPENGSDVLDEHPDVEKLRKELEEALFKLDKEKDLYEKKISSLENENAILEKRIQVQDRELDRLKEKIRKMNSTGQRITSNMEEHLNQIVDYMENTAVSCGISLSNIYVYTSMKEGKNHVNVRGEIYFAPGRDKLSSSLKIKASLYDANGHIEIEGNNYVSTSFSGYDTFDIGWNGGTTESWLSESKIRVFVVKA